MHVIPELDMLELGKVKIDGQMYPVMQIEVVPGPDSDPENL